MAFCRNCGTQMNDGAKFCPKCGQSTDKSPTPQQEYVEQPQEEEPSFVYKMWHSKWNWIGAIVFFTIIVAANTCGGPDTDEVAEVGYKVGYDMGFASGDIIDGNEYIQVAYSNYYPAPSTPEEKEQYDIFAENYKKGFRDGQNAR